MPTDAMSPPPATASGAAPNSGKLDALEPADRLIVALDVASEEAAMELVDQLQGTCRWFKVGMELYYAAGNSVVERLRHRGFEVFLDLKLHDIPNTVAAAVRTVTRAGATLLNVHAGGGEVMMRAAAEAASAPDSPRLLAVTILTSMDQAQLNSVGVPDTPAAQVMRLAKLAKSAGIDGLVCSAEETATLRDALGPEMLLVTPGIRPEGAEIADQRRIATPAGAIANGASMIVVGRPITRAPDPARAAAEILKQMQ
jgi:orotidine-5'-phosphate decarboxylase